MVVEAGFGVRFAGRVAERIRERPRRTCLFAKRVVDATYFLLPLLPFAAFLPPLSALCVTFS